MTTGRERPLDPANQTIAVAFLVRGSDEHWLPSCGRFIESYLSRPAGAAHSLHVLFKGFPDDGALEKAVSLFHGLPCMPAFLEDKGFDIGAYATWADMITEDCICCFNTSSEILAANWLARLRVNLLSTGVGLVGATASYESLGDVYDGFPAFPNAHIRTNAFMIQRRLFCDLTAGVEIRDKVDAYRFESGWDGMTRRVLGLGKEVLVVGRNGRGYPPRFWPLSDTFRQGLQGNLLVADNQTRMYTALPWRKKKEVVASTWGKYIHAN